MGLAFMGRRFRHPEEKLRNFSSARPRTALTMGNDRERSPSRTTPSPDAAEPVRKPAHQIPGPDQVDRIATTIRKPPRPAPLPASHDVGEQIVGSDHWFDIGVARVIGETNLEAAVVRRIEGVGESRVAPVGTPSELRLGSGEEAFATDDHPARLGGGLINSELTVPLRVRFRPQRTGRFRAELVVQHRWDNGHVDEQRMTVTGGARRLDEAPEQPAPAPTSAPKPLDPALTTVEPTAMQVGKLDTAVGRAADAADALANRQRDGLKDAEGYILGGKPNVPKPPWYAGLADLAILMGVGGVAQIVSKLLAAKIVGSLAGSEGAGKRIEDGVSAALKDGLKGAAKTAITQTGEADSAAHSSGDVVVDFFSRQRTILTNLAVKNKDIVRTEQERLLPALGTQPDAVLALFQKLKETFAAAGDGAQETQRISTISQWLVGLGREKAGTQVATRDGVEVGTVTNMSPYFLVKDGAAGILELHVTNPVDNLAIDRLQPTRAWLQGVASAAAQELNGADLAALGIPVKVVVQFPRHTTVITRDEAGRVRVHGRLPNRAAVDLTEEQRNLDARAICELLLARPLASWGLKIETDVASPTSREP
jgi:hypothetical protein